MIKICDGGGTINLSRMTQCTEKVHFLRMNTVGTYKLIRNIFDRLVLAAAILVLMGEWIDECQNANTMCCSSFLMSGRHTAVKHNEPHGLLIPLMIT